MQRSVLLKYFPSMTTTFVKRVALTLALGTFGPQAVDTLPAAAPNVHYQHAGVMSPGAIGRGQLKRGGPLYGYVQPVEIKAPKGALISLAQDGQFDEGAASPRLVGMFVSPVYRLKVTGIALHEGQEVFPTIEVIDRLYPPMGKETRFPIPIELTQEELEMAIAGKFVTRVIYLEDTHTALPHGEAGGQLWHELRASDDALAEADKLGRPVAIMRMGGRLPGNEGPDQEFMFGSPGWTPLSPPEEVIEPEAQVRNVLPRRSPMPGLAPQAKMLLPTRKVNTASYTEEAPTQTAPAQPVFSGAGALRSAANRPGVIKSLQAKPSGSAPYASGRIISGAKRDSNDQNSPSANRAQTIADSSDDSDKAGVEVCVSSDD